MNPRHFSSATTKTALGALVTLAVGFTSAVSGTEGYPLVFVQAPRSAGLVQASNLASAGSDISRTILATRYVLGMRVVVAESEDVAGTVRVVTGDFVCATDPVFSHDGGRLAFAGQRRLRSHLQIWELVGDDPDPRQMVACDADCISPAYVPYGHVLFASLLSKRYEEHGGQYSFSLYSLGPGGDTPTRLTFNPSSDFEPVVLPDGRILFSSWQHVGNHHWPRGVVALMLVNSDGTGVFPLTGNHRGPWLKRGAAARPPVPAYGDSSPARAGKLPVAPSSGAIAFIQSVRFAAFGAGTLATTSLNDAFAEYETLVAADRYEVSDVSPLPGGELLLSARPADGSRPTFGLYVYRDGVVTSLYDDPDYHELAPAVGAPIARPESRVSTAVPGTPHGYLAILNCYDTDRTDQHPLRKGSVKAVRLIEGRPVIAASRMANGEWRMANDARQSTIDNRQSTFDIPGGAGPTFFSVPGREEEPLIRPNSATGYIPARILGEVPPASDGSVYMKVPADRPLRIQLVDRDGFTIINERAWFWVRPNERRICIGCHENRELSPSNAVPLAARRAPTDLTDPAGWQTVSFRKDIQPILNSNCAIAECHVPPTPTAGLNLTADRLNGDKDAVLADRFGPAYANLLGRQKNKPFAIGGRRVHPGDARSSPLLWMLYGRALAPQYTPAPFERPMISAHPGPMLPESQLELIRKWIDLGAQYDDESPPGPWPYRIPRAEVAVKSGGKPVGGKPDAE